MPQEENLKAKVHARAILEIVRDHDAAVFCESFFYITQVWDDLADGDKAVGEPEVSRAFWLALVEMPKNAFFVRHRESLTAFIGQAACAWFDANWLEHGTTHEKTVAFVLRDTVAGLISLCAYLVGGFDYMRLVSPEVRRLAHDEPLGHYLRGLK
jgi:hypothetical protein